MIVIPAVGLGLVFVFLVGYIIMVAVLSLIADRGKGTQIRQQRFLTESNIYKLSIIGGVTTVALLLRYVASVPKDQLAAIENALKVIGILFGLSTFIFSAIAGEQSSVKSRSGNPTIDRSRQKTRRGPAPSTTAPTSGGRDYYRSLVAKAMYDERLANRLIESERQRKPNASFEEMCRSAVERWERDLR